MGMVPELPVAMLACTRLGAPHTVVFGGFSADSLSGRMNDMECEVLITQDEAWRRGSTVPLKRTADEAMARRPGVPRSVVLRRTGNDVADAGRPRPLVARARGRTCSDDPASCPCEPMDSEDLLFLMYTSGTTAKPKGIVHTTGGYLCGVATTHHYIFDLKPDDDVYWCAADIGWITGHSYIVYGPLCNQATSVLYEGTPDYPDKDRWWEIVERYKVTILYTAPTAIRAHMKWGHGVRAEARPLVAAAARVGRRADQPGGVDLVPRVHRRRPHADRRHVVADGDGDDPDHAAAGGDDAEAGLGDEAVPGRRAPACSTSGATRSARAAAAISC